MIRYVERQYKSLCVLIERIRMSFRTTVNLVKRVRVITENCPSSPRSILRFFGRFALPQLALELQT